MTVLWTLASPSMPCVIQLVALISSTLSTMPLMKGSFLKETTNPKLLVPGSKITKTACTSMKESSAHSRMSLLIATSIEQIQADAS